jgi:hypothetical protein
VSIKLLYYNKYGITAHPDYWRARLRQLAAQRLHDAVSRTHGVNCMMGQPLCFKADLGAHRNEGQVRAGSVHRERGGKCLDRAENGRSPQVRDLMIQSVEADIHAAIEARFSLQCRKTAWSPSCPNSIREFAAPAHPSSYESEQEKHFNFLGSSAQLYRVMGLEFRNELF